MTMTPLANILNDMGAAGLRLDHLHAVEAGAGNLSIATNDHLEDLSEYFPDSTPGTELPLAVPELAGFTVFVSGSGCRLRDIHTNPSGTVSAFVIDADGATATWHHHPNRSFTNPTSEFNSHLAVHADQVARRGVSFHALIHAQPPYLVQLSHNDALRNNDAFNGALFRWEPETIVQLPDGVEVLDFMVPGSFELMHNNVRGMREHRITIWSKHGIMVRSDTSLLAAVDLVEYAETGAMYELRNAMAGSSAHGLTTNELKSVIAAFGVKTRFYQD